MTFAVLRLLTYLTAPLIRDHALRTGHNWFWYGTRPWTVRLWCGDMNR